MFLIPYGFFNKRRIQLFDVTIYIFIVIRCFVKAIELTIKFESNMGLLKSINYVKKTISFNL